MRKSLLVLAFLSGLATFAASQATITVTNENLSGPGSLAQAVQDVSPGGIIRFDPNVFWIETDEVGVITKDLIIDGGEQVTLSNAARFQQDSDTVLVVSAANVEIIDANLHSSSFDASASTMVVDQGGRLVLRRAVYTSEWFGTIKVGQDAHFEAIHSSLGGSNLGQAPGGITGDGSASIRLYICRLSFEGPGISVNSGLLEIDNTVTEIGDQVTGISIGNDGGEVVITRSRLEGGFTNVSGSYSILESKINNFYIEDQPLLHLGGSGLVRQSLLFWSWEEPMHQAVNCTGGDLTVLNSYTNGGVVFTSDCDMDIYSTVLVGSPPIDGPLPLAAASDANFNHLYDPAVDPSSEDPGLTDFWVDANSPVVDQGDCSRIPGVFYDYHGYIRYNDEPNVPNAPGGDGCEVGPFEIPAPIPVELSAFNVQLSDSRAFLTWEVATERNNAGFEIQHAEPGRADWQEIGFVPGAGNTEEPRTYSFTTEDLEPGTYSFRLKQIDFDGTFDYLPEVDLEVGIDGPGILYPAYPNPTSGPVTLWLVAPEDQTVTVEVFDALGRQLVDQTQAKVSRNVKTPINLDASDWAAGMYLYRVRGAGLIQTGTLIVAAN